MYIKNEPSVCKKKPCVEVKWGLLLFPWNRKTLFGHDLHTTGGFTGSVKVFDGCSKEHSTKY
jgi:hypothetical protein